MPINWIVDLVTVGVFDLNKTSALAIAIGDRIYWDDAAKVVTTVTGSNMAIGVRVTNAANPSPTVNVRLNGAFILYSCSREQSEFRYSGCYSDDL